MWILIKLLVTAIAFIIRFFGKRFQKASDFNRESKGVKYLIKEHRHKSNVTGTDIKIPFECGSVFKITKESRLDRFFKTIGFAEEFQTGDDTFDKSFYLASDCSEFRAEIKLDSESRKLISSLFANGCESIFCDGYTLTVHYSGSLSSRESSAVDLSIALFRQLSNLGNFRPKFITDPFQLKVLIIEGFIWSLAVYAFTGYIEFIWVREDIHLSVFQVIRKGLLFGAAIAGALVLLIFLFIRGSSRGHRILIESFVVLCVSLPLGGINLVSDLNTNLDKSTPEVVYVKVKNLYFRVTQTRKGGTKTIYYLDIEPEKGNRLPHSIKISREKYTELTGASAVEIKIGEGYLGCPWIKGIYRTDY